MIMRSMAGLFCISPFLAFAKAAFQFVRLFEFAAQPVKEDTMPQYAILW